MTIQAPRHTAYVALGGNLGQMEENLTRAVELLDRADGCTVTARSKFKAYPAEDCRPGAPDYLNAVVAVSTELSPFALQATLKQIEQQMGRPGVHDRQPNQDRVIDLDLLLYNQAVIVTANLIVPHPRMHNRLFVLEPLEQIAADVLHPVLGLTIGQLRHKLNARDVR